MTTLAILQARTTSTRLPGKVLLPLEGEPMILRQLERIKRAESIDGIVVATSTDPSDDELARLLNDRGYHVVRGPLDDVLARFVKALDEFPAETVVRLTADCPLISPQVIDQVVSEFRASGADYLSNTLTPTYPDGLDVEVVKAGVLREVAKEATDQPEREHVTLGIYRKPDKYAVKNFADPQGLNNSDLRWTVDNPDDFEFVSAIYAALWKGNPSFEYQDVLEYLNTNPQLNRTHDASPRNAALAGLETGAMDSRAPRELIFTATYNERDNIGWWIDEVAKARPGSDILIVDDNSPDGTGELIESLQEKYPQITLHSRVGKLGLNTAHLYAMEYAYENGYDVLVTMDADGSHLPNQIPGVVKGLSQAQFCIGTRSHGGTHQAAKGRQILSHGANTIARVLLPMGLTEYTTSFRAFSRPAIKAALNHEYGFSGYAFFIECLEGMHQQGIVMTESPIDFLDRQGGVSKIPKNQIMVSAGALGQMSWTRLANRGRRA
jgi:spore coat polysaccharide biosynthesis protein SpsF